MKNIYKITIAAAAFLTLSSCEDFLTVTPQDSIVAENYYKDEKALSANTASLYGRIWWSFQSQFMWLGGDMLAGDTYYTYDAEGQFYYNQVTAGNSFNNSGWLGLYRVVSFANSIINDMPSAATAAGLSRKAIDKGVAEARFVRAAAYYFLTEYWGEVPIIENSTALITSGNTADIYVNRHTQSSLYRFMCNDLEYAAATLDETPSEPGRVTRWSAQGLLAKVYLTRAAFENSDEYYTKAKELAGEVIEESGLALQPDYSTLFTIEGNNNPESLFAIQCRTGNYGDGSSRNVNFSRSSRIADQTWGAGKGPTLSLQNIYGPKDKRRKYVYMTNGDNYPELARDEGGYTYQYTYRQPVDTKIEDANETLAHLKKYVIGKSTDCNGNVGLNQDAGNHIYILRLADVYMVYVEACIGQGTSTSDSEAMNYLHAVRSRAGYSDDDKLTSISYEDLIVERRREFAIEAINWFDIKRYYYRDQTSALKYLNDMNRDQIYRLDYSSGYDSMTDEEKYAFENNLSNYVLSWQTLSDSEDHDSRVPLSPFTASSMYLQLPAEVVTKAPVLKEPAVDYYTEN